VRICKQIASRILYQDRTRLVKNLQLFIPYYKSTFFLFLRVANSFFFLQIFLLLFVKFLLLPVLHFSVFLNLFSSDSVTILTWLVFFSLIVFIIIIIMVYAASVHPNLYFLWLKLWDSLELFHKLYWYRRHPLSFPKLRTCFWF
jgi:hypothetical protein